jgi:hypothetical protein
MYARSGTGTLGLRDHQRRDRMAHAVRTASTPVVAQPWRLLTKASFVSTPEYGAGYLMVSRAPGAFGHERRVFDMRSRLAGSNAAVAATSTTRSNRQITQIELGSTV